MPVHGHHAWSSCATGASPTWAKGRAGHPLGSRVSESFGSGRDFRFGPPVCHDHHPPRAWRDRPRATHPLRSGAVNTYARRSTGSARGRVPPVCRPIATQPVLSTTPPSLPAPSAPPLPSSSAGRGGAGPRGGEKGGRGACAWAWPTDGATTTRAGAVQAAATVLYSTIHTSCMFCMLSCHATAAATPPPLSPLPSPLPPPSPSPSRPSPRPCRPPRPPFAPPSGPAGSWACRRRLPPPPAPPCPPAPRL